jgi:excisionase family DNA binding protein
MSDAKTVLTLQEVAERLKCPKTTVRLLIDRGKLAAINLGTSTHKRYRVTTQALDAFLDVEPVETPSLPRLEPIGLVTTRYMKRLG